VRRNIYLLSYLLVLTTLAAVPAFAASLNLTSPKSGDGTTAGLSEAGDASTIQVCLDLQASVDHQILMGARFTAVQLFAGIGVKLQWICDRSRGTVIRGIELRLSDHTDPAFLKSALGYAQPWTDTGIRATVFYDRVDELQRGRDPVGVILGYAIAHELTHVLQREDAHAAQGIMRSSWNEQDFQLMRLGTLYFTGADVRAIHRGLVAYAQK